MNIACPTIVGNMGKLSVSLPDSVIDTIEAESRKTGKNRSHIMAEAIEFLVGKGRNIENDIIRLTSELDEKVRTNQSLTEKVGKLEDDLRTKSESVRTLEERANEAEEENKSLSEKVGKWEEDIRTLENQLAETRKNLNVKENELFQQTKRTHTLENQIVEKDKIIESKSKDVMRIQEKVDQAYADANQANTAVAKLESALNAKNDELTFLRGHLSQLTEKIQARLPPSQEEAKAKHWYQLWK